MLNKSQGNKIGPLLSVQPQPRSSERRCEVRKAWCSDKWQVAVEPADFQFGFISKAADFVARAGWQELNSGANVWGGPPTTIALWKSSQKRGCPTKDIRIDSPAHKLAPDK